MKLTALALALFVTGLAASGALAKQPPGKGKQTTTSTTSTTGTTTTPVVKKVLICHATHAKKHPNVLIRVSVKSVHARLKHGDVMPTNGKCPTAATGGTTTSTTTDTTPQTTTSD
jgi:hypothetical protein